MHFFCCSKSLCFSREKAQVCVVCTKQVQQCLKYENTSRCLKYFKPYIYEYVQPLSDIMICSMRTLEGIVLNVTAMKNASETTYPRNEVLDCSGTRIPLYNVKIALIKALVSSLKPSLIYEIYSTTFFLNASAWKFSVIHQSIF